VIPGFGAGTRGDWQISQFIARSGGSVGAAAFASLYPADGHEHRHRQNSLLEGPRREPPAGSAMFLSSFAPGPSAIAADESEGRLALAVYLPLARRKKKQSRLGRGYGAEMIGGD